MAKVQVFLPEPPQEFNSETFRQINLAIETLQQQLNTNYQKEESEKVQRQNWFLMRGGC
jgi:hypothetical protein